MAWPELLLVALAYAAVTLWWLWPLPRYLATHAAPGSPSPIETADWYLIVWALSWGAHDARCRDAVLLAVALALQLLSSVYLASRWC